MGVWAGYVRVSRVGERSETLISPKLQERAIRAWAERAGEEVVMLEAELDASGGDDSRPVLLSAIERIERGELDGLAVWRFDRFTRSLASSLRFLERIEAAGGQLRSASEPLDATTPEGKMVRNFLLSIAQGEREQKGAEFERAKADAVARGIHISGHVPLGYVRAPDRRLVADPVAGPLIAELFRRRIAGASWRELAEHAAGVLGRPMYGPTISRVLANRVYLGEARQGRHVNRDAHEPLVDVATFEAAQLDTPRPARGNNGPSLLGGLIRCAGCSWRMAPTVKRGVREYRCRRRGARGVCPSPTTITAPVVEPLVESAFLALVEAQPVEAQALSDRIAEAEGVLEGAIRARDEFARAVDVAGLGAEHVAAGLRQRARDVEAARRALAEAKLRASPVPAAGIVAEVWPQLSVAERSHVLRRSLSVVWAWRGRGPERVRIIEAGHTDGLSVQGKPAPPRSIEWLDADMPGEIRAPGP